MILRSFLDLRLHHAQFGGQHLQACARPGWHPVILGVGDDLEQSLDAQTTDRRNDSDLRQVRA